VRRINDRYQLISGERRLRAAIEAGWTHVPARLRDADDRLVAELAIVENLQRKDLNPIEKAMSFKRYLDEHHCPQEELAGRLKIDRSTIANLMRLLELPDAIRDAVQSGEVTAGHARALLPLGDDKLQLEFCTRIKVEGLSVREVERQVQERIHEEDGESFPPIAGTIGKPRPKNVQVESLEQKLRTVLGTKVEIRQGSRGRGKITIHFGNHEEFERVWQYMTDEGLGEKLG
jgi:ParB family transcriptional regulator, chromosome partitioning protein